MSGESLFTTGVLAWLLTYAVHSTVLLGGAWFLATRRCVRSERVRETLWKTAVVGGVITASVQLGLGFEPFGGRIPLEAAPTSPGVSAVVPSDVDDEVPLPAPALVRAAPAEELTFAPRPTRTVAPPPATEPTPVVGSVIPGDPLSRWVGLPSRWTDWAIGAWLAGGSVLLVLLAGALRRLHARLAGRRRIEDGPLPGLLALLRRRAGMRRPVRLLVSPRLEAPIAMGTLFPTVCVPPRALTDLSVEMQEAMLAHELAHIVRFDPLWLAVCRLFETVFFFQPLNRVARKRLQASAELLCDDMAVAYTRNRIGLARCLAQVATWILGDRRALPVCGMADLASPLGERVKRILDARPAGAKRPTWTVPAGTALLVATTLIAPGFSGSPAADDAVGDRASEAPGSEPPHGLTPAPTGSPTASPLASAAFADPFADPFAEFERELDALDGELAEIRTQAEDNGVPAHLRAKLAAMEDRVRAARARHDRIQELLTEVAQRRTRPLGNVSIPRDRRSNR